MPETKRRTTQFRELIEAPEILVTVGVYDGFSARIAQNLGIRAGIAGGSSSSESRWGRPDIGLTAAFESVEVCRMLVEAAPEMFLLADGDTGFGNAVNVYDLVRRHERAGIVGVMIEDQTWPKKCGHMDGTKLISTEEMIGKIEAAVEARSDPDFVVMARTDAATEFGIEEAIRRSNRYAEAGATVLFADAVRSEEDIALFAREVNGPVMSNQGFGIRSRGTTPVVSPAKLQEYGVAIAHYSRLLAAGSIFGMQSALSALIDMIRTDEFVERPDLIVTFEEINALVDFDKYADIEKRFVR